MSIFDSKDVLTALELVDRIPDLIRSAQTNSLIEYTRPTRVEPVCLVDIRASQLPYIDDVLYTALNNFTAYYLQAVSLTVNVGNVNVVKLLDKLNPSRNPMDSALNNNWGGLASSLEGKLAFSDDVASPYTQEANVDGKQVTSGSTGSNTQIVKFNDDSNLSVGKLVEVNIESEGQKATFAIQVRLRTMTIRSDALVTAMALNKKASSARETWHAWRSGQIRFINDVVMATDMIEEHKTALRKDTSGYYKSRIDTKRKNRIASVLSGNPSVATASSIFVMTVDTARELESKARGKLKRFKDRERIFEETYGMMFFIIDPDHEMITIYNRSIEEPTEVSVREIQRGNKNGSGPDIVEILNAMRESKAPGF